jgi:hypothetical protein
MITKKGRDMGGG